MGKTDDETRLLFFLNKELKCISTKNDVELWFTKYT